MNYKIKRCKICNKMIHVHSKKNRHGLTLKNVCEHIPKDMIEGSHESALRKYLK